MSFLAGKLLKFNVAALVQRCFNGEQIAGIHTSSVLSNSNNKFLSGPRKFKEYNKQVFEPQTPAEEPRPAFICHIKKNIKYSPKKMWYVASLIRGMSIDEAIRQLSFVSKKGAGPVKESLLEAQELAVKRHNVEYKSNLWVAESFCGKGKVFKGVRRHARKRVGEVEYKHSHYFVRLEEGKPPADYYNRTVTPEQQLDNWVEQLRRRKVANSL